LGAHIPPVQEKNDGHWAHDRGWQWPVVHVWVGGQSLSPWHDGEQ
jgi:hypothetical protein